MASKIRVYLSGGLHSNWQDKVIDALGDSYEFIDPRENRKLPLDEIAKRNKEKLQQCSVIVCYLEKNNPSGIGLLVELGYAHALGLQIYFINEKEGKYYRYPALFSDYYYNDFNKFLKKIS